jgi:hypothetical protein
MQQDRRALCQDSVGSKAIAVGRIDTGRRACDTLTQAAEDHVIGVLQVVSSYAVIGDVLAMTGSGGTLRFKAVAQP